MDKSFLHLCLGLLILISSNIILGSIDALFTKKFQYDLFIRGVVKGALVILVIGGVYITGSLNPDIIAIEVAGQRLTVLAAINAVVLGSYIFYAPKVIEKLMTILKANPQNNSTHSGTILNK